MLILVLFTSCAIFFRKPFPMPIYSIVSSMLSSRSFKVFIFICRPLINFDLILVQGER